jgi:hypothetical protein
MPSLSVSNLTVGEGDRYVDIVVRLDAAATAKVTVSYTTAPWTADEGAYYDFVPVSGTLSFNPGETSKVVRVELVEARVSPGSDVEIDQRFKFVLSGPSNATLADQGYAWVTVVDNDTPMDNPELFVRDVVVDEASGSASFVVQLGRLHGQSSSGTVSVDYATVDGSAMAGQDFVSTSGRLTFLPGESVKTVTVALVNDAVAEGAESFGLLLSNPATAVVVRGQAQATIGANDAAPAAQPRLVVSDMTVGEGDRYVDVVVSLSAPATSRVGVNFATVGWTADEGRYYDFVPLSGTLSFDPGETTQVVRIDLVEAGVSPGSDVEIDQRFKFVLSGPSNATLADQGYAWVTVVDNDTPMDNPELFVRDVVVDEASGSASFVVQLGRLHGQSSSGTVSVDYATVDGSAMAGQDFVSTSGRLTFLPGESVKTVTVALVNDAVAEGAESFGLLLSNPATAVVVRGQAQATIGANDAAPAAQPRLVVSDMTVGEGDRYVDVVVSLSAPATSRVGVNFATVGWTADEGSYYDFVPLSGTLSFDPGETTQVVRIDLVEAGVSPGSDVEADQRFKFVLSGPSNATLADQGYAWVTLVDNDTAKDNPELWVRDVLMDEAGGVAKFVVTLGRSVGESAQNAVTVNYRTKDGTAKAGSDYGATAGTLTFLPGESTQTVSVPIFNDGLAEPLEFFDLALSHATTGVIADGAARALIEANDGTAAGQPTISASGGVVIEEEGLASVLVSLSAPSTRTVTVKYATQNDTARGNDYGAASGTLTFLPGETAKAVQVQIASDAEVEGTEKFKFVLSSPSNAIVATATRDVVIVDGQVGDVVVHSLGLGNDTYEVTSGSDQFIELQLVGGTDTVLSHVNGYTLPAGVEVLVFAHPSVTDANGNAGDNTFVGNGANNRLDGGPGIDTVVFTGSAAAHTIDGTVASRTVRSTADGTDTLLSIERLHFDDALLAFDTSPGGQTYLAWAFLNAAFDHAPDTATLSYWTAELGRRSGNTVDLAQEMINHYAPGVSDTDLVAYLWSTVVESPITPEDLGAFVGLIRNGSHTQASLVDLAAQHALNTAELVGIVGTTLSLDPALFPVTGA